MRLDVQVSGKTVAQLYRERDEYVLKYLPGTDAAEFVSLTMLAVVGGAGIGRVTVTPEGGKPGMQMDPLQVENLLAADNTTKHFAALVRRYARASISGMVPKFIAPEDVPQGERGPLGKPTLRTSRHIIKGSDYSTPYLGSDARPPERDRLVVGRSELLASPRRKR